MVTKVESKKEKEVRLLVLNLYHLQDELERIRATNDGSVSYYQVLQRQTDVLTRRLWGYC